MSADRRTAREWLLARHSSAASQLDAARGRALRQSAGSPPAALTTGSLLRALFFPARFGWTAVAVAWLVLAVIHFTVARPPQVTSPRNVPPEAIARYLAQFQSHDTFAQINHLD